MAFDRFGIVSKVVARTYQVEEVVAEGGFGVVYRAYHKGFRARVALKCLKIPDELSEEQRKKFLEQFRSEAEVMFRLSSHIPAIVRPLHVDAFHTQDGRLVPFMALEWLDGRTLDSLVARRAAKGKAPLALPRVVRLLSPVAAALERAHHFPGHDGMMTVIHRDMKPENLFVTRVGGEDVAKVLDFGISKVKSAANQLAGRASRTSDTLAAFSPAYAAPEQWSPATFGQTGKWTDVWGLALTVVEVAKGEEVVLGDHAQMMGMILSPDQPLSPRSQGVIVSDAVERVFRAALTIDPAQRTQTVGRFWDELTAALGLQNELGRVSYDAVQPGGESVRVMTGGFDSEWPKPQNTRLAQQRPGSPGGPAPSREPLESEPMALPAVGGVGRRDAPLPPARPPLSSEVGGMMVVQSAGRPDRPNPRRPRAHVAGPSTMQLLGPALSMMAFSIALTVLDRAHVAARGAPVALGPLKLSWVAAFIMVFGIVSAVRIVARIGDR